MRVLASAVILLFLAGPASAGPASGTVKSATGTISPKFAIAYTVRDMRNARSNNIELMLTEVAVDASKLRGELDPHMAAINFKEIEDRNYLLLWVRADGSVGMNATYSKTMTQYLNDTTGMLSSGGLKAELTTNTATKVEGRVFSSVPLKTMDGPTYTIDVKFSADVIPGLTGTALPAGGGDPAKAFNAFIAAIKSKNWTGIKAGLSPPMLASYDKSYDTPKENLDSAVDILSARIPMTNAKVTGGFLVDPSNAVLEMESERFGTKVLTLVQMLKTGAAWQYDDSTPAGNLR